MGAVDAHGRLFSAIRSRIRHGYPVVKSLPAPIKISGGEDGWVSHELDAHMVLDKGVTIPMATAIEEAEQAIRKDIELLASLAGAYKTETDKFRGALKNDVASISAASSKLRNEVEGMVKTFNHLLAAWGSDTMKAALDNAERMAVALEKISQVQNSQITFAVIDKKPGA